MNVAFEAGAAGLAQRFEEQRPRLRGVAYRMLGSLSEAEDAVQDAWIRANRADTTAVDNLGGWLTTIVARVCLNRLRTRRPATGGIAGFADLPIASCGPRDRPGPRRRSCSAMPSVWP